MPHLDFREALSTPEEKLPPTIQAVAAVSTPVIPNRSTTDFWNGLRLNRSTWTNIVFVAIASIGGLVCAFYFFNGGELLRAAASWPSEYLYPRPLVNDRIAAAAEQPNPADHYSAATEAGSSSTAKEAKSFSDNNQAPTELAPLASTTAPTTPPGVIQPPPVPQPPPLFLDQLIGDVNNLLSGADSLVQSVYQNVTSTQPIGMAVQTTRGAVRSTKHKVSTTKQKLVTTTTHNTSSTARNLQQTQTNPNAVSAVSNQMMSRGGLGGVGSAGAIGGLGSGAGVGGLGGVGGVGGLNGGGLGGGISGTGIGGLPGGLPVGHH